MNITRNHILIFAGLLMLALAGCTDPFRSGTEPISGEIPAGKGLARISLGRSGERTALPDISGYFFTLDFTAPGKTPENETLDSGSSLELTVALEPATWTLAVKGYANAFDAADPEAAPLISGSIRIPINAGTDSSFVVYLTPDFGAGGTGSLSYTIGGLTSGIQVGLALYPLDAGTNREETIVSPGETLIGTIPDLPVGTYQVVIDLYKDRQQHRSVDRGGAYFQGLYFYLPVSCFYRSQFCPRSLVGTA
jgi:hypothetical protein